MKDLLGRSAGRIVEFAVVTVRKRHSHCTRTSFGVETAGGWASTPGGPGANFAVHRARSMVAREGLGSSTAMLAAISRRGQRTSSGVGTWTAGHTACSSSVIISDVPRTLNTVLGACEIVAKSDIHVVRTFLATVAGACDNAGANLHALTQTARYRTVTENTPCTNFTINGALIGVAVLGPRHSTTFLATIIRSTHGGASRTLGASAARNGARCGPARPFPIDTVNRAFDKVTIPRGSLDVVFITGAMTVGHTSNTAVGARNE